MTKTAKFVNLTITEHDRLYVRFVMTMDNEQFDKYMKLPTARRDYLFDLWVGLQKGIPLPAKEEKEEDLSDPKCSSCGRVNGHYIFCATLPKNQNR